MAQARRARRAGRPRPDAILLEGSYSFEQKITVEWETALGLDELDGLLAPILAEPRSFAEIRAYVSGALKQRDTDVPAQQDQQVPGIRPLAPGGAGRL